MKTTSSSTRSPRKKSSSEPKPSFLKEAWLFVIDIFYNAVVIILLVVLIRSFLVSPFRIVGSSMADTLQSKEFIIINKLGYRLGEPRRKDIIVFRPPITGKYDAKFEQELATDSVGNLLLPIDDLIKTKDLFYCKIPGAVYAPPCRETIEPGDLLYIEKIGPTPFSNENDLRKQVIQKADVAQSTLSLRGEPDTRYHLSIYDDMGPEFFIKRIIGLPGETVKIASGKVYIQEKGSAVFYELDESYLNSQNQGHTILQQESQEQFFSVPEEHYFTLGDNRNFSNDSRSWTTPLDRMPTPFISREAISGKATLILWPLEAIQWIRHDS